MTLPEFKVKYLASKGGAPIKVTADALVAAIVPPSGTASPIRCKELFMGKRDEHPLPSLPQKECSSPLWKEDRGGRWRQGGGRWKRTLMPKEEESGGGDQRRRADEDSGIEEEDACRTTLVV